MANEELQSDSRVIGEDEGPSNMDRTISKIKNVCIKEWMERMNTGALSCADFKKCWRIWVPKIYSPKLDGNCVGFSIEEDKAQGLLFDTLEEFICNGDPQVVLKQLSQMDNPPSVCARVFKLGEPTYSCRECSIDLTCVLCVECFKQSAHRNHKYKMGTSNGGGCCDCGDPEAWKKEPSCTVHLAGTQAKESDEKKLPVDVAERARVTFEAVLKYAYDLLSLEHCPDLPPDLTEKEKNPLSTLILPDTYCTVLFNDETHTFEQVINTLTRVIRCSQRDAIEYVTNIDREGRAVVKCSNFQHCHDLRSDIEKFTSRHNNRPLKVLVIHAHVVAHQAFAMKLLNWLQQFIITCEGFRIIFTKVALHTEFQGMSIVDGILIRDSQLWKSARAAWHRLFISGMLMEYESKKALATVFTHNYGPVMKDFINDDHDHSFSIVSLSVQLFTVPTLAHHLIAHHDVLFILLNTFISESLQRCNALGKLEFERNAPYPAFKRARFILYDLKYLLYSKPHVWTDELRRGFLQGMSLLLNLLCSMQCMDAVLRQVGQHTEYEPEWEPAFHLHINLSPVISLAIEWCSSDRIVLIKTFRLVLKKLYEQPGIDSGPGQVRELADHSASCLQYDVSSEPVSIHLPLSRFLAGLFLCLEKHNLNFQSAEFSNQTKPTPEQIIEPVLTAQAMISQVHAGMWRRNGYSLLNQLYFYHNVKCRSEMLDRDIILLQAGASMIESNEFLIHVLNKFNLLNWANREFEANALRNPEEESIKQTINLVEELLGLLITIVGERYVPGVGQVTAEDRLKKEIIQQLCIKPLSHSELSKTLPEDVHLQTEMENVIQDVADFKKPSQDSAGKGVYELKPHLYAEYNVFFYHYTKEELSKSEEAQRKRRVAQGELECCPPPKLPKLTETFSLVANLLQSDVMLHIMQTVLERALNFMARSFSEPQVHKILHLIGYALQEQQSGNYPFLIFTERAVRWNIYKLLEELSASSRIEAHKDLLKWTLNKYREVAGTNMATAAAPTVSTDAQSEQSAEDAEPPNKTDKEWRTKMAAQKRAKIMAQMEDMQRHFMKKNAKLFEKAGKVNEKGAVMDVSECSDAAPVALGSGQTAKLLEEKSYTCILCQEDQTITANGPAMVFAAFVQQSTVLCQNRANIPNIDEPDPLYLSAKLGASPHTSTCGHIMHAHCWQDYFDNVLSKENRRPYRLRQPASFDVEKHEYLCPLCECLSNTVLPLLPTLASLQQSPPPVHDLTFSDWLVCQRLTLDCKSPSRLAKIRALKETHDPLCRYCSSANSQVMEEDNPSEPNAVMACPIETIRQELGKCVADAFEQSYGQAGPILSENLLAMIHLYAQATYTKGLGAEPHEGDSRVPLLAWKSTAYTVHAVEFLLRDLEVPLIGSCPSRRKYGLQGLARISAVLGSTGISSRTSPTWADKVTIGNHALSLLAMLLENHHEGPSVLDWDPFGVLVPLIHSLPSLYSTGKDASPALITGGVHELHALTLVFLSLIVKILLTMDFNKHDDMEVDVQGEEEQEEDNEGCGKWNTCDNGENHSIVTLTELLGISIGNQTASGLWKRVKNACMPFLRCCTLYFYYVTDVPAPAELATQEGSTYENTCKYLGLPATCDQLLKPNIEQILILANIWKSHRVVQMHLANDSLVSKRVIKEPLKVNKLVKLPDDYSELINTISLFTCPNSEREDSRNPTMCLVCGEMLCSQSYCCQTELNKITVGACTYHASKCGTGVGVFLRVRECEILLLRNPNRGAFICPPYLDEYGETDQGLRRGYPLKLCKLKYGQLNQLWLEHAVHESIARAIEYSNGLMPMQWQYL
ncbi:E3 ubiquitin-protein ligase UBR2 [Prorops nasuta]|uniref:E3 ubiquitin-protein ligase UBR2 n=1 Tax=Prorops nasuta TaxID=863751 RepID=UPI0034CFCE57